MVRGCDGAFGARETGTKPPRQRIQNERALRAAALRRSISPISIATAELLSHRRPSVLLLIELPELVEISPISASA